MGLRFRRSVRLFPGVRLNFSRSGVSTTVGVRGASMTLGQQGAHLNLGLPGTGLSYRTRISPPASKPLRVAEPASLWPEPQRPPSRGGPGVAAIPGTEQEIRSADVTQLTSAGLNELKSLINAARQRKSELLHEHVITAEALRRASGRLRFAESVIVRLATERWIPDLVNTANLAHDAHEDIKAQLDGCYVEVDFNLGTQARVSYANLVEAFERVTSCRRIWDITSRAGVDRVAARTTASTALTREPVIFEKVEPELVRTEFNVLRLGNANGRPLQIYPGFFMMREANGDFALIEFDEVDCRYAQSNFIEEEGAPADATQIDATWKYANKNGSRDMRFNNNYQIPVMQYGAFALSSRAGLAEAYMVSDFEKGASFARALTEHERQLSLGSIADAVALAVPMDETIEGQDLFEGPPAFVAKPRKHLAFDWVLLSVLVLALVSGVRWTQMRWSEMNAGAAKDAVEPASVAAPQPVAVEKKPVRPMRRASSRTDVDATPATAVPQPVAEPSENATAEPSDAVPNETPSNEALATAIY